MAAGLSCRVCSGELRLLLPGSDAAAGADAFSPSCHELGLHGDLFVCHECGAVRAAGAAVRGGAARAVPRDARRLLPDRGGRPARDRTPPARAHRRAGSRGAAAGRRLRTRAAARRGADGAGTTSSASSSRGRRRSMRATRSAWTCARWRWRTSTTPADSTSSSSRTSSSTWTTRSARIARCADLLRPGGVVCVVTPDPSSRHRAARRAALVGLPARAHAACSPAGRCASS